MATLKEIIRLAKELPESCFTEVYALMEKAKTDALVAEKTAPVVCPYCGGRTVKNGKKDDSQSFLCRDCGKSFLERATSAIAHSQSSTAVWKSVIRDTVQGVSLDETAKDLELAHSTVFHMRHKILNCVEQAILTAPVKLDGACQTDETYILENEKGRVFPELYHREPRKNGKASLPGLSEEYVCLCTSVTSEGKCIAKAVNRATPSKDEIDSVFADRIEDDTILLVDGNKGYNVLKDRCIVLRVEDEDRIKVDRFHSFIKERLRKYRGVSTIYLNRYAALFSQIFGKTDETVDRILKLLQKRNHSFASIESIKTVNLLSI
jgi:transposase-like protein